MATALLYPSYTPHDYHRILSPGLEANQSPVPVGLIKCQRDPLLKELKTTMISCKESSIPASKKSANKKITGSASSGIVLEVVLHDTILFPEGGGQPSDIGYLTVISSGAKYNISRIERHGGIAVHYLAIPASTPPVLEPGTEVLVDLGPDGWDRRYDHMTMHTSQHLLSAIFESSPWNIQTTGWSLTSTGACYVDLERAVTAEEVARVQNEANKLVFEGRRVFVEVDHMRPSNEASSVPSDYTGGVKRVVIIDGVDRNPCCGTHLPSLHNLQLFLIPPAPSTSTSRLFFLAGPRLISHLSQTHISLNDSSTTLSCALGDVPERVKQVVDERRRAVKRVEDVEREVADMIAAGLVREMQETEGLWVKIVHRTDDSTACLAFLSSIANAFTRLIPPGKSQLYLLVLTSSPSSQTTSSTTTVLIAGSGPDQVKSLGEALKAKLGSAIKGGGKGRWSGKFVGVWKEEGKEGKAVKEVLDAINGI